MTLRARASLRLVALVALVASTLAPTLPSPADEVVLENRHVRYVIAADGINRAFVDRASGTNLLRPTPPSSCASVRQGSRSFAASRVTRTGR